MRPTSSHFRQKSVGIAPEITQNIPIFSSAGEFFMYWSGWKSSAQPYVSIWLRKMPRNKRLGCLNYTQYPFFVSRSFQIMFADLFCGGCHVHVDIIHMYDIGRRFPFSIWKMARKHDLKRWNTRTEATMHILGVGVAWCVAISVTFYIWGREVLFSGMYGN